MLSNSDSKFIKSLQLKKYRKSTGLFVTEGQKNILELVASNIKISRLLLTRQFYDEQRKNIGKWCEEVEIVNEKDLVKCGTFRTNDTGMAIAHIPEDDTLNCDQGSLTIVLEDVRDPGNLGTILRIANWYGLKSIVCSQGCADCYNTKVINSSMGSFFWVKCIYTDLPSFLNSNKNMPIIGTTLDGDNLHDYSFPSQAIVVMGNESIGISQELQNYLTTKIRIPGHGQAESLNVAIASAIVCDNFFRQTNK